MFRVFSETIFKMSMETFLKHWFTHPNYWFQSNDSVDSYLSEMYIHLLDKPIEHTLGDLIIHDQLIRHVERNCLSNHILQYHLQIALKIHEQLDPSSLTPIEWCFWALPIRHEKNPKNIFQLLNKAWKRMAEPVLLANPGTLSPDPWIQKFIKATYQRMPMEQSIHLTYHFYPYSYQHICSYDSILAYVSKRPMNFEIQSSLGPMVQSFIKQYNPLKLLLSLSGGVDSMVCSYVLKQLNIPFEAIHINYCNRDSKERDFVIAWCGFLQIPLYVRNMTEIQREPCMTHDLRNTYESYTRNVRYECYRTLAKKGMVLLGHNQDDCFENILTNLCHQHKYDQLKGMSEESHVDGIRFGRPLLMIPKSTIYDEAHRLGIPYLKDSTPSWSQRGKIRDSVRPALEHWDSRMIPALFHLSDQLNELSGYRDSLVQQLQFNTCVETDGFTLKKPLFKIGYVLWKQYLHTQGIPIKHKSLIHFMEHSGTNKSCMLTKEWKVCFKEYEWLFIRTTI